jgi:hypothetical protein
MHTITGVRSLRDIRAKGARGAAASGDLTLEFIKGVDFKDYYRHDRGGVLEGILARVKKVVLRCNVDGSDIQLGAFPNAHTLVYGDGVTTIKRPSILVVTHPVTTLSKVDASQDTGSVGREPERGTFSRIARVVVGPTVRDIRTEAFMRWEHLETVELHEGLRTISPGAFLHSPHLRTITLPDTLEYIGRYAFAETGLTEISLPPHAITGGEDDGCDDYGALLFSNCTSLVRCVIRGEPTTIGMYMFDGCTALRSVRLPPSVITIDNGAFLNCSVLASIDLPDALETIGDDAFGGCAALRRFWFPTDLESLGDRCFMGSGLTHVDMSPADLYCTDIGKECFAACPNLVCVVVGAAVCIIGKYAFRENPALALVVFKHDIDITPESRIFASCPNMRLIVCAGRPDMSALTDRMNPVTGTATTHHHAFAPSHQIIVRAHRNPFAVFRDLAYISPATVHNAHAAAPVCATILMIASRLCHHHPHRALASTTTTSANVLPPLPVEMWYAIIAMLKWYDTAHQQ